MYLVSATLKHYEDQGRIKEDLPLLRWSVRDALYDAQQAIDQILSNFPVKALATLLRWTLLPRGMPFRPPLDARNRECAKLVLEPGAARDRLTASVFVSKNEADATFVLEAAFLADLACEPIDRKLREAMKSGRLESRPGVDTAATAHDLGILSSEELQKWQRREALRRNVIKVDDFPQDFGRAEALQKLASEEILKAKAA
jgi:acyl-CoA dehydrogenase